MAAVVGSILLAWPGLLGSMGGGTAITSVQGGAIVGTQRDRRGGLPRFPSYRTYSIACEPGHAPSLPTLPAPEIADLIGNAVRDGVPPPRTTRSEHPRGIHRPNRRSGEICRPQIGRASPARSRSIRRRLPSKMVKVERRAIDSRGDQTDRVVRQETPPHLTRRGIDTMLRSVFLLHSTTRFHFLSVTDVLGA